LFPLQRTPGPADGLLRRGLHPRLTPTASERSEVDGGRQRVVLCTPDTSWVRRLALRLGEDGRIIEPAELAAAVRVDAATALAHYGIASA
jgi:predicted DNA-binding transcriptional regulator YafY